MSVLETDIFESLGIEGDVEIKVTSIGGVPVSSRRLSDLEIEFDIIVKAENDENAKDALVTETISSLTTAVNSDTILQPR